LVSFGDSPTVLEEEIIAIIQSRIGEDGADRVRVLLLTVNYQAHVEIERDMVKKVSGPISNQSFHL
jgi:hypothetical protein